jgi:hypothetical protein
MPQSFPVALSSATSPICSSIPNLSNHSPASYLHADSRFFILAFSQLRDYGDPFCRPQGWRLIADRAQIEGSCQEVGFMLREIMGILDEETRAPTIWFSFHSPI